MFCKVTDPMCSGVTCTYRVLQKRQLGPINGLQQWSEDRPCCT